MPKLKTNSGAKKRFKLTKSGKIKRQHTNRRHILESKAPGTKRRLRKAGLVAKVDQPGIMKLLPYG